MRGGPMGRFDCINYQCISLRPLSLWDPVV